MEKKLLTILSNKELCGGTFEMRLGGCDTEMRAGQFVELSAEGFYLRRPISVCDWEAGVLTIVYKVVGGGTSALSKMTATDKIDALTGLGNGFCADAEKPLLIGGGIGAAPLFKLAKEFNDKGIRPKIVLGFRNAAEVFYYDEFSALGDLILTTDDGSIGFCGNAVEAVKSAEPNYDKYYACGPAVMLAALKAYDERGELSLEARMGCGFGACMGCSIQTPNGPKRVCKEGPVFKASEVLFREGGKL